MSSFVIQEQRYCSGWGVSKGLHTELDEGIRDVQVREGWPVSHT